jgi:hypothetical protein
LHGVAGAQQQDWRLVAAAAHLGEQTQPIAIGQTEVQYQCAEGGVAQ